MKCPVSRDCHECALSYDIHTLVTAKGVDYEVVTSCDDDVISSRLKQVQMEQEQAAQQQGG